MPSLRRLYRSSKGVMARALGLGCKIPQKFMFSILASRELTIRCGFIASSRSCFSYNRLARGYCTERSVLTRIAIEYVRIQ